jgi:hypothetical protein
MVGCSHHAGVQNPRAGVEDPKIGAFFLSSLPKLQEIHAGVYRGMVADQDLLRIYSRIPPGESILRSKEFKNIENIANSGIDVILTIRWPVSEKSKVDRVPYGKDREASLRLLEKVLHDLGPYIQIYSIQNEVLGGPGQYDRRDTIAGADGKIPAIEWLKELTQTARRVIRSDPKLSHIKISSPAFTGFSFLVLGHEHKNVELVRSKKNFFDAILQFSNQYCDYLDLHLISLNLADMQATVKLMRQRSPLPFIASEWGEVYGLRAWFQRGVSPDFKRKYNSEVPMSTIVTNQDFMNYSFEHQVSREMWNDFVATSPSEAKFIQKSYDLFLKYRFRYACWSIGHQHQPTAYSFKAIFADRSIRSEDQGNALVYDNFVALTRTLKSSRY